MVVEINTLNYTSALDCKICIEFILYGSKLYYMLNLWKNFGILWTNCESWRINLVVVHMHWFLLNIGFMVHLNYALELCWCDVHWTMCTPTKSYVYEPSLLIAYIIQVLSLGLVLWLLYWRWYVQRKRCEPNVKDNHGAGPHSITSGGPTLNPSNRVSLCPSNSSTFPIWSL